MHDKACILSSEKVQVFNCVRGRSQYTTTLMYSVSGFPTIGFPKLQGVILPWRGPLHVSYVNISVYEM